MATALRPIGHEDKLSLVDHLDELRRRLIICVLTLVVAFGVCFWQNDAVLDIVTHPAESTQNLTNPDPDTKDPTEQNALFQKRLKVSLATQAASQRDLRVALQALAGDENATVTQKAALQVAAQSMATSQRTLNSAAAAIPKNPGRQLVTLGVAEPFTSTVTIALYAAFLLAMPMILYQLYAFVLPAFSPGERKVALPLMMMVPALFIAGVAFGYFVVLERAVEFLQNFNDDSYDILLQANTYFKFVVVFVAGIGLLFQIPVAVLAVTRTGVMTPKQLAKNRGYVILGISVLAAVATPTPDPVTMTLAMGPLILLFEVSILVARWIERISPARKGLFDYGDDDEDEDEEDEDDEDFFELYDDDDDEADDDPLDDPDDDDHRD